MAKKSQNDKRPARPVAVPSHRKSGRISDIKVDPIAKKANFGQKGPQKCHFPVRMALFGKVL